MNKKRLFFNRIRIFFRDFLDIFGFFGSIVLLCALLLILSSVCIGLGISVKETWNWVMNNNIVSTIFFCLLGLLFISALITFLSIFSKRFRLVIFARIIFIFWLVSLLGVSMYSTLMTVISKVTNFNLSIFRDELASIAFLFFLFISLGYLIILFFTHFSLGVYSRRHYTLYLRSFKSDGIYSNIENTISELKSNYINVLTIANPKTFFRKAIGHTLYLPSVNWKKFLEYYIIKAESVIVVVDDSDGVMWEMFQHQDQFHKYVFIVPNKQVLQNITNKLTSQSDITSQLTELVETAQSDSFMFTIRRGKYKVYDIKHLYKYISQAHSKRKSNTRDIKVQEITHEEVIKIDYIRNAKENALNLLETIWDFITDIFEDIDGFFRYNRLFNMCLFTFAGIFCLVLGLVLIVISIEQCIDEDYLFDAYDVVLFLLSLLSIFFSVACFKKLRDL